MIRFGSPLHRLLEARENGACAWHGHSCDTDTLVPHHRANRGHGGHKAGDSASNLLLVCADINSLMESDADIAAEARRRCIKISRHADPATVPVLHSIWGWALLNPDGSITMHDREEESHEDPQYQT